MKKETGEDDDDHLFEGTNGGTFFQMSAVPPTSFIQMSAVPGENVDELDDDLGFDDIVSKTSDSDPTTSSSLLELNSQTGPNLVSG